MPATVTIANNTAVSGEYKLGNLTLTGIRLPAFTNAAITFLVSTDDGSTFEELHNLAGLVTHAATTGNIFIALDPKDFLGVQRVKIQSGTTAAPVNQGAARVITLTFRAI